MIWKDSSFGLPEHHYARLTEPPLAPAAQFDSRRMSLSEPPHSPPDHRFSTFSEPPPTPVNDRHMRLVESSLAPANCHGVRHSAQWHLPEPPQAPPQALSHSPQAPRDIRYSSLSKAPDRDWIFPAEPPCAPPDDRGWSPAGYPSVMADRHRTRCTGSPFLPLDSHIGVSETPRQICFAEARKNSGQHHSPSTALPMMNPAAPPLDSRQTGSAVLQFRDSDKCDTMIMNRAAPCSGDRRSEGRQVKEIDENLRLNHWLMNVAEREPDEDKYLLNHKVPSDRVLSPALDMKVPCNPVGSADVSDSKRRYLVALDINGTIIEGDSIKGEKCERKLTEPANRLLDAARDDNAQVLFYTFGQDHDAVVELVRQRGHYVPEENFYFIARPLIKEVGFKDEEVWAFPMCGKDESHYIRRTAKNPVLDVPCPEHVPIIEEIPASSVMSDLRKRSALRFRDLKSFGSFVDALLDNGCVVFRAHYDEGNSFFRGRAHPEWNYCKILSTSRHVVAYDDNPRDWQIHCLLDNTSLTLRPDRNYPDGKVAASSPTHSPETKTRTWGDTNKKIVEVVSPQNAAKNSAPETETNMAAQFQSFRCAKAEALVAHALATASSPGEMKIALMAMQDAFDKLESDKKALEVEVMEHQTARKVAEERAIAAEKSQAGWFSAAKEMKKRADDKAKEVEDLRAQVAAMSSGSRLGDTTGKYGSQEQLVAAKPQAATARESAETAPTVTASEELRREDAAVRLQAAHRGHAARKYVDERRAESQSRPKDNSQPVQLDMTANGQFDEEVKRLLEMVKQQDERGRCSDCTLLLQLAKKKLPSPLRALEVIASEDSKSEVRKAACYALGRVGDSVSSSTIAVLESATNDGDGSVVLAACSALGSLGGVQILERIAQERESRRVRYAACITLGDLGDKIGPSTLAVLENATKDRGHRLSEHVRQAGCIALGNLGDKMGPSTITVLKSAIKDPDADVRRAARGALAQHFKGSLLPTAIENMDKLASKNDAVRRQACDALATLCDETGQSIITACLEGVAVHDADHQVREAAFEALRQMSFHGVTSAIEALASMTSDEHEERHLRNNSRKLLRRESAEHLSKQSETSSTRSDVSNRSEETPSRRQRAFQAVAQYGSQCRTKAEPSNKAPAGGSVNGAQTAENKHQKQSEVRLDAGTSSPMTRKETMEQLMSDSRGKVTNSDHGDRVKLQDEEKMECRNKLESALASGQLEKELDTHIRKDRMNQKSSAASREMNGNNNDEIIRQEDKYYASSHTAEIDANHDGSFTQKEISSCNKQASSDNDDDSF